MPITGKFEADFTDFSRAVQDADLQLRSFEDDSRKVAASLGRMADSFSGRAIVQEATLMAESIERLGGVTSLTFAEITRVGSATQAALAKIQVMGLEAPAALQRVAAATREAQLAMAQYATQVVTTSEVIVAAGAASKGGLAALGGGLSGGILNVAGLGAVGRLAAAGGGIGIASAAVVLMGKSLLDTADAMQKMSDQTGLTLEEVQKLQYVSDQTSVSMQSLVAATQNMQRGLGAGDKGLTKALKDLNIDFAAFRQLKPWDQMIQLADAIDQLEDPTQKAIAANAAFGKAWKETIAAIRGGMLDLSHDAPTMADDTARALDFIGDKIGWVWGETKSWLADLVTAPFRVVDAARALVGLESMFPERKQPTGGVLGGDETPEDTGRAKRATDEYGESVKRADDIQRRFKEGLDATNATHREQQEVIRKTIEAQQAEDDKYIQQITGLDKYNEAVTNADRIQRAHVDINALSLEATKTLNAETNKAIEIALQQTSTDAGLLTQLQALATATAAHIAALEAEQEAMRKSVAEANALTEAYLKAEQASIGFTAQQAFERSGQASGMTATQIAGFKEGIVATGQSAADEKRFAEYAKLLKELNAPLQYGTGVAPPVAAPGGGVVNNTFHINDTLENATRKMAAELGKQYMVGTQWALTQNG